MKVKQDIANKIASDYKLKAEDATRIVTDVLQSIIKIVTSEGRIELRNFATIEARKKPERVYRNPKSGEECLIPEHYSLKFREGKLVKRYINTFRGKPFDELPDISEIKQEQGAGDSESSVSNANVEISKQQATLDVKDEPEKDKTNTNADTPS